MTEVIPVSGHDRDEPAAFDVVFLHGLHGDGRKTWTAPETKGYWPSWLATANPQANVMALDFDAWSVKWKDHAMGLFDRAVNILSVLKEHGVGHRPLCLIGHSMGGLLAKKLVLVATTRDEFQPVASMAKGFVFLATPHTGAGLANLANWLKVVARPTAATLDLLNNSALLRELSDDFRNWSDKVGTANLVFFETRPTRGVLIVDQVSANPGIAQVSPRPVDADHVSICKPVSRDAFVYRQVNDFIQQFANWPDSPGLNPSTGAGNTFFTVSDNRATNIYNSGDVDNSRYTVYQTGLPSSHDVAVHVNVSDGLRLLPDATVKLRVDLINNGHDTRRLGLRTIGSVPPEICSFADQVIEIKPRSSRTTELTIGYAAPYQPPGDREFQVEAIEVSADHPVKGESDRIFLTFVPKTAAEFSSVAASRLGRNDKYEITARLHNRGNTPVSGGLHVAGAPVNGSVHVKPEGVDNLPPGTDVRIQVTIAFSDRPPLDRDLTLALVLGNGTASLLARSDPITVRRVGWLADAARGATEILGQAREALARARHWTGQTKPVKRGRLLAGAAAILVAGLLSGFVLGNASGTGQAAPPSDPNTETGPPVTVLPLDRDFYQPMQPCPPGTFVVLLGTLKDGDDKHAKYNWEDAQARADRIAPALKKSGLPVRASEWSTVCDKVKTKHAGSGGGNTSWRIVWIGPVGSQVAGNQVCLDLHTEDCSVVQAG